MKQLSQHKTHVILSILISGFFLLLDQGFKFFAFRYQDVAAYIVEPWIGWEYFGNPGIAFSLPIPHAAVLFLTPLVLLALFIFYAKKEHKTVLFTLAAILIFGGAVSNYIDRFLFELTIDYIRLGTSVINIADIMIVTGAVMLLFQNEEKKK